MPLQYHIYNNFNASSNGKFHTEMFNADNPSNN